MKNSRKLSFFLLWMVAVSVRSEVVTDGTLGVVQNLSGQMIIPQNLGKTAGNNLFHSFQTFNINTGESATFTGNNLIHNVISRVTGGQISTIDGLLKSEIPNANFYFINPAGVTFGANAQVDVPAAFHVSTANSLKFADGSQFSATDTTVSTLSISEPTSFGFLGNQAGDINLQSSSLTFANKKAVSFTSSGDVNFDNSVLLNPSGAVTINARGSVSLTNNSSIESSTDSADKGGDISVTAEKLIINNSHIHSDAKENSQGNAGVIGITGDNLTLLNGGISSDTFATGNAGDVVINVGKTLVDGQGSFATITSGTYNYNLMQPGNAGVVRITGDSLTVLNGGIISSDTFGAGNAGDVVINVGKTLVNGPHTVISSGTLYIFRPSGNAGVVHITGDSLTVLNGGEISSNTFGPGNAGDVVINVGKTVVDGQGYTANISSSSFNFAPFDQSVGNSGVVHITGDSLTVLNGGKISSQTFSSGNAGDVVVNVSQVLVDGHGINDTSINSNAENRSRGNAGVVTIKSKFVDILNGGFISSSTFGNGNAGHVHVDANSLNIDGNNLDFSVLTGVFSRAESGSNGGAGHIFITAAENIDLHDHGKISSSSTSMRAGNVVVSAPIIAIDNARISSTAKPDSTGQTGNLTVSASQFLSMTNQSSISIQNNATITDFTGIKEGLLIISAPDIDLKNSSISAGSTGNVNSSHIVINFTHSLTMDPSFITTSANLGNGGNITINGGGLISLQNSGFLTSVTGANGNGGNINVNANTLIMNNAVIQANAVGGAGGDINLNLKSLIPSESLLIKGGSQVIWQPFVSGLNVIQAASANGVNGEVHVSSPQFNISGSLIGLETQVLSLVVENNPCLSATAYSSSLTRAGKGGLPVHEASHIFVPQIAAHNALKNTEEALTPALLSNTGSLPEKALPCAAL